MILGHVGLNVTDLDRSLAFYRAALGLELRHEGSEGGRRWAALGPASHSVLTLWQQSSGSFAPERPGLHHVAFRVENAEALRAAEARIRALGATFAYEGVVPHAEGSASGGVFFHDPDGSRVEIFTPAAEATGPAPSGDAPTCGFF